MGISTPIHDAMAQAVDALRGLDLSFDLPAGAADPEPVHDPVPTVAPTVAEDAERVVALAWAEAAERGHGSFGTGHLLLGLVRADGPERELLAAAGVTVATAGAAMALVASSSVSEPVRRVTPGRGRGPVANSAVAKVLGTAGGGGAVTATDLLTTLLARPWGQAAEMLAALGVDADDLTEALAVLADRPEVAPRTMPRDPSGLLSSAWRRPAEA